MQRIGAIVVHGSFYIHAGPASLDDAGFGSTGCVEIIGDYDVFKAAIATTGGLDPAQADLAIQKLVAARKLVVTIQNALVPDIKKQVTRKIAD